MTTPVSPPTDGARNFGISLTRIYGYDKKEDVFNYDYDDDRKGQAMRYRFIIGPIYYAFLKQMMPQINAAGWHLTAVTPQGSRRWQLVFEPTLAPRTPRNAVFWHLTPQADVTSILQSGLQPRQSRHGFKYPQQRIYLIRDGEKAFMMADAFAERDERPIDYAVLKVDLRKATGITLHVDPELATAAVYTTQPIPPRFLSMAHETVPSPSWLRKAG